MKSVKSKILDSVHKAYEETMVEVYRAIPDDYVVKYNVVIVEMMKRNLTKRQTNIVSLILSLSFKMGKDDAIINRLQYFEGAGVSKTKIRSELDKLVGNKVLHWNKEEHRFSVRDVFDWNIPINDCYKVRFVHQSYLDNLNDANFDTSRIITAVNNMSLIELDDERLK